jgi:hypothetical protein
MKNVRHGETVDIGEKKRQAGTANLMDNNAVPSQSVTACKYSRRPFRPFSLRWQYGQLIS